MISIDQQTIIVGMLLSAVFVNKALGFAVACQDPPYLLHLQNEVRQFYTITSDPDDLTQQGPCSYNHGNQIGRPRWPVSTFESWHSQMSTCPWVLHIDEDINGLRFPCRIATARLTLDSSNGNNIIPHHLRPQTCLSAPGSRYRRSDNKLCKRILQTVPVVAITGCRNGINDYAIQNITINVGFTCTFVQ